MTGTRDSSWILLCCLLAVLTGGTTACSCSSDSSDGTSEDTDPADTDGDSDGDSDGDTDPDAARRRYPDLRDGRAYASLLKMLDSLAQMPDYQLELPASLQSAATMGGPGNRTVFDPDSVENILSNEYPQFLNAVATAPGEFSLIKGMMDFLRSYLSQTSIPQGEVAVLGRQEIRFLHQYDFHQTEMTMEMEMGRFMWFRDDDTGAITIQSFATAILSSMMPDRLMNMTLTATPLPGGDPDEPLYRYDIYQAEPGHVRDGDRMDPIMVHISYNEENRQLLSYIRTVFPFSNANTDHLHHVSYLYRRYIPPLDTDNDMFVFYEERSNANLIAEIDPSTGKILGWLDDDEETELETPPTDWRVTRNGALGNDDGAILIWESMGPIATFADVNGHVILRQYVIEEDNGSPQMPWWIDDVHTASSWPLKYIRSTDPLQPIETTEQDLGDGSVRNRYFVGDEELPVQDQMMGMYDADGNWDPDVPVPFLQNPTLPSIVEMLPEVQSLVDQLSAEMASRIRHLPLSIETLPFYRFPTETFTPVLLHGLGGVWVSTDETLEDGTVDVLQVDVQPALSRFEYRRYVTDADGLITLDEVAAGILDNFAGTVITDDEGTPYDGALQFRLRNMRKSTAEEWIPSNEWVTPEDTHAPAFLSLPDFVRANLPHALVGFRRNGLELQLFPFWTPEAPSLPFVSVPHDPMVALLATQEAADDPDAADDTEDAPLLPPIIWTVITADGTFVETTFMEDTWQEVHFHVDAQRNVSVLRAFRGIHTVDATTGSGTVTVTTLYDPETREWIAQADNPDEFTTRIDSCVYLSGLSTWNVTLNIDYETMMMTMEEPAPATVYTYRRQTSGVELTACLVGACTPVAASHCEAAVGGVFQGRGMSHSLDQWNPSSVVAACTSNCWNYSMCYRAQRSAYYIDCTNQLMLCSEDWTPIDVESCDKVDTFPAMNQAYQDCLRQCQMELDVVFPDPAPMLSNVEQCVAKYGAYPTN